jgi:hypothetical protein
MSPAVGAVLPAAPAVVVPRPADDVRSRRHDDGWRGDHDRAGRRTGDHWRLGGKRNVHAARPDDGDGGEQNGQRDEALHGPASCLADVSGGARIQEACGARRFGAAAG